MKTPSPERDLRCPRLLVLCLAVQFAAAAASPMPASAQARSATIYEPFPEVGNEFGKQLDFSDGTVILSGGEKVYLIEDSGGFNWEVVAEFSLPPNEASADDVAIHEGTALIGLGGNSEIWVLERQNGTWAVVDTLAGAGGFGNMVDLSNQVLAAISYPRMVYIFDRQGGAYSPAGEFTLPNSEGAGGTDLKEFAVTDEYVLVGSPDADAVGGDSGRVHGYEKDSSGDWGWSFPIIGPAAFSKFGGYLSASDQLLVVGAGGPSGPTGTHVYSSAGDDWEKVTELEYAVACVDATFLVAGTTTYQYSGGVLAESGSIAESGYGNCATDGGIVVSSRYRDNTFGLDGAGAIIISEARAPDPPLIAVPAQDETVRRNPLLEWQPVQGAIDYEVLIESVSTGATQWSTTTTSAAAKVNTLPANANLRLKVRARNGIGSGEWGETLFSTNSNHAPSAVDDLVTTNEDEAVSVSPAANDSDLDGDALVVDFLQEPTFGTLTRSSDDQFLFEPFANVFGSEDLPYTITDANGITDAATVSLTINSIPDAPTAVDDPVSMTEDGTISVSVLANDSDGDGDPLALEIVDSQDTGSGSISGSAILYTPPANGFGQFVYQYRVSDGTGRSAIGNIIASVSEVNDNPTAATDSLSLEEDTTADLSPLANDSDVDGDGIVLTSIGPANKGSISDLGDGVFRYTPRPDANGMDEVPYAISDGRGGEAVGRIVVTIDSVNDAPTRPAITDPAPESLILVEGQPSDIVTFVWTPSSDADGDDISYTWEAVSDSASATIKVLTTTTASTFAELGIDWLAATLDNRGIAPGSIDTLYHRVIATDGQVSTEGYYRAIRFERGSVVTVEADAEVPHSLTLGQIYPVPASETVFTRVGVPSAGDLFITIYDLLGRRVRSTSVAAAAGWAEYVLSVSDLRAGLYIARVAFGGTTRTASILVVK